MINNNLFIPNHLNNSKPNNNIYKINKKLFNHKMNSLINFNKTMNNNNNLFNNNSSSS